MRCPNRPSSPSLTWLFAFASFASFASSACLASSGGAESDTPSPPEAHATAPAPLSSRDVASDVDVEVAGEVAGEIVPAGRFESLEALCAAQEELTRLTLAARAVAVVDLDEETPDQPDDVYVPVPSCTVDPESLVGVAVELAPPWRELGAVTAETGDAMATFLAVRDDRGWLAVPASLLLAYHEDQGCGALLRETELVSVRITAELEEAPSRLVVGTRAVRDAFGEEELPSAPPPPSDDAYALVTLDQERACDLAERGACTAPAVVASTVTWEETP